MSENEFYDQATDEVQDMLAQDFRDANPDSVHCVDNGQDNQELFNSREFRAWMNW